MSTPSLPKDIADAWFHVTASGEAYSSIVSRGCDLRAVIGELMFGTRNPEGEEIESIMTDLADPDWWGRSWGCAVQCSIACGEDPDIEVKRIEDRKLLALLADSDFKTGSLFG